VIKNSLDKLSLQIANGALFKFNSSGNQLINRLITGQGRLAMTGTGTLTLSGPNSYTGGTTVSAGILTFLTTAAKTGSTTVDADATLGLGVGGSGTFTSANVDSLFAGTLAGVTMGPAVNVALDTTNGDFTYATNQSAARSLTKLGANTLTLTGTNSYSGGTNVMAGTLTFLNPAAKTGSTTVAAGATLGLGVGAGLFSLTDVDDLWANTLANVSMDAASGVGIDTTAGDLSYATSQSGSRSLTKLGANTLTVSGDNSYTGLTTVSVGTLKLGAAGSGANSPLGTAGAGTLVRPGAALDLNGFTLATAEALTSD
jgi:autotransporter-associated beta strand protein